jgi:hypothetical protein
LIHEFLDDAHLEGESPGMSEARVLVPARIISYRNPLGRYRPTKVTPVTRWKFGRRRREEYLRRIGGEPDHRQAELIARLIDAEWRIIELEDRARQATDRGAIEHCERLVAEYNRQMVLLDRDLAAATKAAAAMSAPVPADPVEEFRAHLAELDRQKKERIKREAAE